MDVIIEDGPHTIDSQERFLQVMFPFVKPGGYYIIEDIGYNQGGVKKFKTPKLLMDETRSILQANDCIFVDTTIGHRGWEQWVKRWGQMWVKNHIEHNSYLLVIRKRDRPLKEVKINSEGIAMQTNAIIKERDI